jgi:hypothetical protein
MQAVANTGWRKRVRVEDYFFRLDFDPHRPISLHHVSKAKFMINANLSMVDDLEVATIGPWRSVIDGTQSGDYLKFHQEMETHTVYQWLGLELHSMSQGASELSYRDRVVHAVSMSDTCGNPVSKGTLLSVGGQLMPVFAIASDEPINWPAG